MGKHACEFRCDSLCACACLYTHVVLGKMVWLCTFHMVQQWGSHITCCARLEVPGDGHRQGI